jgi:hypothetical protein
MVSPVHGDHRRCQAEIPLIVLCRFPEPVLLLEKTGKFDQIKTFDLVIFVLYFHNVFKRGFSFFIASSERVR